MTGSFRPFRWSELLRGTPVYAFEEFYVAKDVLLRYDERTGYLNYGWWEDGPSTPNPSAALVARMLRSLAPGPGDVVLDVGSGLGQPAVDAARATGARVVGVNRDPVQVEIANARAAREGLADRVRHRVLDARALEELGDARPTAAMFVESLAEMPDLPRVLAGLSTVLPPGARVVACDVVRRPARGWRRAASRALTAATSLLYGDAWRTPDELVAALEAAGFVDPRVESLGAEVYPETWRHARGRMGELRRRSAHAVTAGSLAWANLRGLDLLHRAGEVDYVLLSARRA